VPGAGLDAQTFTVVGQQYAELVMRPTAYRSTHLPWRAVPGEAHERRLKANLEAVSA